MTATIRQLATALVAATCLAMPAGAATTGSPAPAITATQWLNSAPLQMQGLRGHVVLVEFWTRGCWNCGNVEPYIKRWQAHYRNEGLVVIGVHAPEFAYEHDIEGLRSYLRNHQISYPIAVDNDFTTWHAWHNRAWPTLYLVDKRGVVRYQRIGEGGYAQSEAMIRRLLAQE